MQDDLQQAITNYLEGTATPEEQQLVNNWYYSFNDEEVEIPTPDLQLRKQVRQRIHAHLLQTIYHRDTGSGKWFRIAAAILVLVVAITGALRYTHRHEPAAPVAQTSKSRPVMPGGNRAVLVLANGDTILLDDASNGELGQQGNTRIVKLDSGQLAYQAGGTNNGTVTYNTIRTPRGGQFRITLPDGTLVWLNAASSLRFPTAFSGNSRQVALEGEGYFEVASRPRQPFIVNIHSGKEEMKVKVLGTKFNIMAYEDERTMDAALLEGAILAGNSADSIQVQPGQKAVVLHGQSQFKTALANFREILAWKNGEFRFKDADIRAIMRQLCRWYDVSVEYRNNADNVKLSGLIPKTEDISQLLDALQATGKVHFEVTDRKIIVQTN